MKDKKDDYGAVALRNPYTGTADRGSIRRKQ